MTSPDNSAEVVAIPQEIMDAAAKALDAMPEHGVQMRHHRIENVARAIMAHSEALSKRLAEAEGEIETLRAYIVEADSAALSQYGRG